MSLGISRFVGKCRDMFDICFFKSEANVIFDVATSLPGASERRQAERIVPRTFDEAERRHERSTRPRPPPSSPVGTRTTRDHGARKRSGIGARAERIACGAERERSAGAELGSTAAPSLGQPAAQGPSLRCPTHPETREGRDPPPCSVRSKPSERAEPERRGERRLG